MAAKNKETKKHAPNTEQSQMPEKTITTETSNILDAEFKTLVIRMLNELRGRVDELSEKINKEIRNKKTELQSIKKNQSEMKNTFTEIENNYRE